MELPVYKGPDFGPEPLVNRRWLDRLEMHSADTLQPTDKEGKIGPAKYDIVPATKLTRPSSASYGFGTSPRLGYVLQATKDPNSMFAAQKRSKDESPDGRKSSKPEFNRPKSARVVLVSGRGHWIDGMAKGTTITGVYNRFRVQIPGVAKYDIAQASEKIRPHSARASFGTGARFPGQKPITPRAPTSSTNAAPFSFQTSDRPSSARSNRSPSRQPNISHPSAAIPKVPRPPAR